MDGSVFPRICIYEIRLAWLAKCLAYPTRMHRWQKKFVEQGILIHGACRVRMSAVIKPGEVWPLHIALGHRMAIACALYTARYTSVTSPLRGRNTDNRVNYSSHPAKTLSILNPRELGQFQKIQCFFEHLIFCLDLSKNSWILERKMFLFYQQIDNRDEMGWTESEGNIPCQDHLFVYLTSAIITSREKQWNVITISQSWSNPDKFQISMCKSLARSAWIHQVQTNVPAI